MPSFVGFSNGDIRAPDRRTICGTLALISPNSWISIKTSVCSGDANGLESVSPSITWTRIDNASPNTSRRTHEVSTLLRNWVCFATAYSRYCASARSIFIGWVTAVCTLPFASNDTPSNVGLACCRRQRQRLSSGSLATRPCKNAERLEISVWSSSTSADVNLQSPDTSPHIAPPPTASQGSTQEADTDAARRDRSMR